MPAQLPSVPLGVVTGSRRGYERLVEHAGQCHPPTTGRLRTSEATIPDTTQGLVLLGPDEFEIREVPVPSPAPDEVLCEVHSVAICGTDAELIGGNLLKKGWPPGYPYTPGHEVVTPWVDSVSTPGG